MTKPGGVFRYINIQINKMMKNNLNKGIKIFEIKNRGIGPNSSVCKLTYKIMKNVKKGVLYTIKMNLILGLYRRLK